MLRRLTGPPTTSTEDRVDRVGPEMCANQLVVELTEGDHMLGDGRLSHTRAGKRDYVLRRRRLQLSTDARYPSVTQVVKISEKIALVSFHPPLGGHVHEPAEKPLQVTRVGIDGLGTPGQPVQPKHERTGGRRGVDSRVQVPPDPVLLTVDRVLAPAAHDCPRRL